MNPTISIVSIYLKKFFYKPWLAFILIFTCLSNSVHADMHEFKNNVSTNWSDIANWSPAELPLPTDSVHIPTGETLTLDANYTANTFILEDGAFIYGAYTLTISGNFNFEGGSIDDATVLVGSDLIMTKPFERVLRFCTVEVSGTASWTNGLINIGTGGTLKILASGVFSVDHTDNLSISGINPSNAILEVAGVMTKSQNSSTTINCEFILSGTCSLNNGVIYATGGGGYTGDILINGGSSFDLGGGTHEFNTDGDVYGTGDFKVSGGIANFNAGSSFNSVNPTSCDIFLSSGTINDYTGLSSIVNITQSGSSEFGGSAQSTVSGNYNWQQGTISGTKNISGVLNINGSGSKTVAGTINITGTGSTWTDGRISIPNNGILNVASGANFSIDHASTEQLGSGSSGIFEINGTVSKTQNSQTRFRSKLQTKSGGVFNINSGTFNCYIGSSGTNEGTITIASGAVFEVSREIQNFSSGAVATGDGVLKLTSQGDAVFSSGSTMATNLEITGSSSIYTDNVGTTPSSITMSNGTFNGTGTAVCSGALNWSGGTIGGSSSLTINGLSTFSGTTRTLDTKMLDLVGNGDWTTGDFVFATSCTLKVNTASTLFLTHTANQQITGTGLLYIMGTMQKTVASTTTTISSSSKNNGRVEGIGSLVFGALDNENVHAPGLSGVGNLGVSIFDNNKGVLEIEIGGNGGPGTGHDQLQVGTSANLGGNLQVSLLNGFVPNVGDSYTILTAFSVLGTFTENLPELPNDREWASDYNAGDVTISVQALLPVELSRFEAKAIKDKVELKWRTDSETNNRGFEVQRSYDGFQWRSIKFVNGGGTTANTRNYDYVDYPKPGIVYYRLRQVDWDGQFDLSKVVSVVVSADGSYRFAEVHPNPVEDHEINVAFPNGLDVLAFYTLTDASGRIVQKGAFEPGEGYLRTTVKALRVSRNNVYYMTISSGNTQETIKLIFN